jgi:hypothetical protein
MSTTGTTNMKAPQRSPAITTSSLLFLILGAGFLAANVPVIGYMMKNRAFPVVLGIPLLGSSFSERLGMDFMIRASFLFEVVNALEVLAGYWLWKSDKRGGRLGLILLPAGIFFWILFELPIPLVAGPMRAAALAIGWKTLR